MTHTKTLAVALLVLASGTHVFGVRSLDRSELLTALDQRAATGIPRHLDHDDGQELQDAVTAALNANPNDGELAWAALRASFMAVPSASPVIFDSMPTITLEVLPPFMLPWNATADMTLDASVDGSDWQRALDHAMPLVPGALSPIPIPKLFPGAAAPGFHVVRFRATFQFAGGPRLLRTSDTRELPVVTYGITGGLGDGQRLAALLDSAALAKASDFDPGLPKMPLGVWLRTVAGSPSGPTIYWTGHWCDERAGLDDQPKTSICARAMVGASPGVNHGEVWFKIATADTSGPNPTWTAVAPTLEGVDLIADSRSTVDLAGLPSALRSSSDEWPHATLVLNPNAIALTPATPKPGEPVTISIELRNTGASDMFGTGIDVTVGDATDALAHRQFIRSIPAGQSVIVKTDAVFPRGYGVVTVIALTGADAVFQTLLSDPSRWGRVAWRAVRPDLAPPDFKERMTALIGCTPGCPPTVR